MSHRRFDHSFSEKTLNEIYLAKIINKSSRGVDGMSASVFEQNLSSHMETIRKKVISGQYRLSPYVELQVSKGRGKAPRILSIPTIRDQVALSALKEHLHAKFSSCVGRELPYWYIFELMEFVRTRGSEELCFIRADITGFYDNIDRERLMNRVRKTKISRCALKLLYRSIITPTVPRFTSPSQRYRFYSPAGIPQGLSISNILANIYMSGFDEKFKRMVPLYMRYVDDILLIFPQSERRNLIENLRFDIAKLGLTLNDSKSELGQLGNDVFDFLGYIVGRNKNNRENVFISVRKSSVDRLVQSFAHTITGADNRKGEFQKPYKLNASAYREMLIEDLNEKITGAVSQNRRYGWLFYFSQMNDVALLHRLDQTVVKLCERSNVLLKRKPDSLKSFVRAFREIHATRTGTKSDYLLDYDEFDLRSKKAFLVRHGISSGKKSMSVEKINSLFKETIARRMSRLEADLKSLS